MANKKTGKKWSNRAILRHIPNPTKKAYEVMIDDPEITFLGVRDQPDFAEAVITIYPRDLVIELRSLKHYFQQFRPMIISYERLINVVYEDLMAVYKPKRLRLVMWFKARGGIRSKITIDSDWKARGGREAFRDWAGHLDKM